MAIVKKFNSLSERINRKFWELQISKDSKTKRVLSIVVTAYNIVGFPSRITEQVLRAATYKVHRINRLFAEVFIVVVSSIVLKISKEELPNDDEN